MPARMHNGDLEKIAASSSKAVLLKNKTESWWLHMNVSPITNSWDVYNVSKVRPAQKTTSVDKRQDTFTISSTAKDFQTALKQLSTVSDVREERINSLQPQLASGQYNVSAQEIADKIFASGFNTQA